MDKFTAAVFAAGCFWGTSGFFSRNLSMYGFTSPSMIIVRCGLAAAAFLITALVQNPSSLKIKVKDIPVFLGTGFCSLLFFSYCYYQAISMISMAVAATLLYIAPAVVMVLSAVLFKEKITPVKAAACVLSLLGCALVSGIFGGVELNMTGFLWGLGAGFGYGLYSIFSRMALDRGYSSVAINFYACFLAALGAAVIWGISSPMTIIAAESGCRIYCLLMGLISCYFPYLFFTYGLSGMAGETGKASVIASVEPVVACIIGWAAFGEKPDLMMILGMGVVLAAIVMLNRKEKSE